MRFIHAADLHLDSPLRGLERYEGAPVEAIRGATRRALENLVALAIDEEADFLLIAGDVFDGDWQDYNTGLFFARQMRQLEEAGIPVFLISGNHDAASVITKSLTLPANVIQMSTREPETRVLDDLGVAIHGQGFTKRHVEENIAVTYPPPIAGRFNVGILHTSATGSTDHGVYAPCTVADLTAKKYDYWALGHIHKREALSTDPHIHFSGNIQGRHMGETGAKGCLIVEVEGGVVSELRFAPLDVLRWEHLAVQADTIDDLLDGFESGARSLRDDAEGRLLALRVRITGGPALLTRYGGNPGGLRAELRNAADAVGGIWLEKTVLRRAAAEATNLDGSLEDVAAVLADLRAGHLTLETLAPELTALRQKLAAERPEAAAFLDDSDGLVAEAYDLLLARLGSGGSER